VQKDDKKRPYHLHIANALWPDKSLALQAEFLQLTQAHYLAGIRPVDFGAAEESRKIINNWVEEKTREKIKDLLLAGDVGAGTRLVLTNAIYFKAAWQTQFPKGDTRDAVFEVPPGKQVTVPMMRHSEGTFNYFAGDGFQWLELPYKGDRLSMVLLLPQQKGKLAELEKQLTAAGLQKGLDNLKMCSGDVFMPRFKIALRLSLLKVLTEMGMSAGPFTAIAESESLSIADVIHKAFIDVDEVGTEAAAATAVIFMNEKPGFSFRADHPFLFMIRDRQMRSILFLGRVIDPRSAN
jgi:serpin B